MRGSMVTWRCRSSKLLDTESRGDDGRLSVNRVQARKRGIRLAPWLAEGYMELAEAEKKIRLEIRGTQDYAWQ